MIFLLVLRRTKKDLDWVKLKPKERKRLTNLFCSAKKAARMVLMHATSYPIFDSDAVTYKKQILEIAVEAVDRIQNEYEIGQKVITMHTLNQTLENIYFYVRIVCSHV